MELFHALTSSTERFTDFQLTWLTQLPPVVLWLALGVLAAGLVLSFGTTRGAPSSIRFGLLAFRTFGALALFAVLLEPGLKLLKKEQIVNKVHILMDESASMTDVYPERFRKSVDVLQQVKKQLGTQRERFQGQSWAFAATSRRLSLEEESSWFRQPAAGSDDLAKPERQGTDLQKALAALPASTDESPLGGVLIISDGADTTGLRETLSPGILQEVRRLGVPVHAYVVDDGVPFRDLAIEEVIHDEFAFVRNEVKLEVLIRHKGIGSKTIPVTLYEDGKEMASTQVTLQSDASRIRVPFSFRPKRAGKRLYTVRVPVDPEERIVQNNRLDFTLKVIRDRLRVLQVSGHPSWDERFLRQLLKENPSVDLISFFILRTPTDQSGAPSSELSLIPFPTRQLFTEELHTFDIVIFQDFDYLPYNMSHYLGNIRDFVKDAGGGFLMIGGDRTFSEGAYKHTPVGDILPVELLSGRGHINEESFKPFLTAAGKTHPITDLGQAYGGDQSFNEFHPLEGVNRVARPKANAQTLLAHPFLNDVNGKPLPVVAVSEVGRGRTMAIMTDSTWMWSLPQAATGGRADAHRKFYANALRWLIQDPELSRVRVQLAQKEVAPGETVLVEIHSLNEAYRLDGGAQVTFKISPLDEGPSHAAFPAEEGVTGEDGKWLVKRTFESPGAYRLEVQAKKDGQFIGRDDEILIVQGARKELLYSEPRPELLRTLAEASGGEFVAGGGFKSNWDFKDQKQFRVVQQKSIPIWNRYWALFVVLLGAAVEWWWRRRRGFA